MMADSEFMPIAAALDAGWIQTPYTAHGDVACPVCETLIAFIKADGSTDCPSCDWKPGLWPANDSEQAAFVTIRNLRLGRNPRAYTASDVAKLRRFIISGDFLTKEPRANLHLNLSPEALARLAFMKESGFFGPTIEAVADELLRTAIRQYKRIEF